MIKFYSHAMPSIGAYDGRAAGSLISLLDRCIAGFGDCTPTAFSVTAGIGTLTVSGHSFVDHCVALVTVTGQAGMSGEFKVKSATNTSVTLYCPGIPDGAATGAISAKVAGMNMQKAFSSGTTRAAYKFTNPEALQAFMYIEDKGFDGNPQSLNARVKVFENMTDIDHGYNPMPPPSQNADGGYFRKGTRGAGNLQFYLVTDGRFMYFMNDSYPGQVNHICWAFGTFNAYRSTDPYAVMLFAPVHSENYGDQSFHYASNGFCPQWVFRADNAMVGSIPTYAMGCFPGGNQHPGQQGLGGDIVDRLYTFPRLIVDSNASGWQWGKIRGEVPGYVFPSQRLSVYPATGTVFDGNGALSGRKLLVCAGSMNDPQGDVNPNAYFMIDLTGPW
ncbi:hypothetical protein FDI24_gp070 [Acidovorax phage ACP17]|uniref:Uncharacterized protein n=1 Tax=Acidovorax phage ACP17 TaxID=2010329 RepID=A0A223AJ03_9CAUD|nr:hypothetical protein FDI24_gp070 [Acidovorax phage ACP17]ASS33934.1 hypothetical protein [Acidovorax phage ACP17]